MWELQVGDFPSASSPFPETSSGAFGMEQPLQHRGHEWSHPLSLSLSLSPSSPTRTYISERNPAELFPTPSLSTSVYIFKLYLSFSSPYRTLLVLGHPRSVCQFEKYRIALLWQCRTQCRLKGFRYSIALYTVTPCERNFWLTYPDDNSGFRFSTFRLRLCDVLVFFFFYYFVSYFSCTKNHFYFILIIYYYYYCVACFVYIYYKKIREEKCINVENPQLSSVVILPVNSLCANYRNSRHN